MESIEQPFDSITRIGQDMGETHDKAGLIETDGHPKHYRNGESPGAESSPLHQDKSTNSILHGPQNQGLRIIIISSVVFAVAVTVALILTIYLEPKQVHGHAAVATDDIRCSEIGLQTLRDGGNAVDAAVAAAFCVGVVNPAHSGIGGGGFSIVHDHKFQKSWGYDFRETAPAAMGQLPDPIKSKDIRLVGIPGMVKGLAEMHSAHGKLPWKDLLQPAVNLAINGFTVSEELAKVLSTQDKADFTEAPMHVFLKSGGEFKEVNDTIVLSDLATSLQLLQSDPNSLYTGFLQENFIADLKGLDVQSPITAQDLTDYKVNTPEVLKTKLKELTVIGLPPPAGGTLVALMLNMIDDLGWKAKQSNDSLTYHQLIEVFKYGLAQRSLLGDPAYLNMTQLVQQLTSPEFAAALVKNISNNATYNNIDHYGPSRLLSNSAGTSHLSVIDASEVMVTLTMSINTAFGSRLRLPKTGILLNDELADFTDDSLSPNAPQGGKRPQSSMSPTVVVNTEHPCAHRLVLGASGGMRISTAIVETIVNSVVFSKNISSAISAPRVHAQWYPQKVTLVESGIPQNVIDDLKAKGHTLTKWPAADLGMVMGIEKTNDNIGAYSDYRKLGAAVIY